MIIAYGDLKEATWAMRAHGRIRTLAITNGKKKEKLQFKLAADCVYLFCRDGSPYEIDNKIQSCHKLMIHYTAGGKAYINVHGSRLHISEFCRL